MRRAHGEVKVGRGEVAVVSRVVGAWVRVVVAGEGSRGWMGWMGEGVVAGFPV